MRRLAAGEKDDDLPPRLERNGSVEDLFRVLERRFVHITDLICIHKARIAHHVAAVRQIDGEHRSAAKFNIRSPVVMDVFVLSRFKIAAVKQRFDAFEKLRDRSPSHRQTRRASGRSFSSRPGRFPRRSVP